LNNSPEPFSDNLDDQEQTAPDQHGAPHARPEEHERRPAHPARPRDPESLEEASQGAFASANPALQLPTSSTEAIDAAATGAGLEPITSPSETVGAGVEPQPEPGAQASGWQAEGLWGPPSEEANPAAGEAPGALESSIPDEGPVSQDFDRTWQRIEEAYEQKRTLSALVVDRVKGGLLVDIGMQGFVPASHVSTGKAHDLEKFVGRTLKLRITDLDRERQRVVLSARLPMEEEHSKRKKETMERLKVGLISDGVVRRLTDFGAFVDIGGVDGLLHVSEMSWSRVKHPKEVVSPGDHIKVKVLKISDDHKKISLGMRQLLPDPWTGIESQFKVGEMVSGRVVRVVPFGAFVQVRDGVEAILPNSEISNRKPKPEEIPQVGDAVTAKVIELRPSDRRMTLSVRRVQEDQDRKEYQQHVQTQSTSRTTIGDLFGDMLSEWKEDQAQPEDEG